MPTAEASISTDRPERYLAQICKHATAMAGGDHQAGLHQGRQDGRARDVRVECTDTRGVLTFSPGGTCTVVAGSNLLTLRIDAADEESLGHLQGILTRDLDRFGRRDGLVVAWQRSDP